jgi:hypothetical protein
MKQTKPANTKAKPGRKEKAGSDDNPDFNTDVWFLEQEGILSSFQSEYEQANEHRFFN